MADFQDDDYSATASDIARRIRERKLSSVAVVEALAARIKKHNRTLNAFVDIRLEENLKAARLEAEMKDRLLKEHPGMKVGPLHGVPVAIKDDLAVRGMPLTNGSRLCGTERKDFPDYQDAAVTRLIDAGAIVLGKTHMPEFGHKGTTDNMLGPGGTRLVTTNPWDVTKTAGGSSGGSASAVAAGMAYLALGSDTGGSVRIPASCCGVVGHKPTFGIAPRVPSGNAFSLWTLGPLARTVGDAALAMQILSGPHPQDRFSRPLDPADSFDLKRPLPKRLRVAWHPSLTGFPVDDSVQKLAREALEKWAKQAGAEVVEPKEQYLTAAEGAELLASLTDVLTSDLFAYAMDAANLKTVADFARAADKFSPTFAEFGKKAAGSLELVRHITGQAALTEFCESQAAERLNGFDLIACPTLAVSPFDKDLPLGPDRVGGTRTNPHLGWYFTWPANVTGEPAVSIPAAWTREGLPVGLQLSGPRGFDGLVLRVAAAIEQAAPWSARQPKL